MTNKTEQGAAVAVREAFIAWHIEHVSRTPSLDAPAGMYADDKKAFAAFQAGMAYAIPTSEGYTSSGWTEVALGLPEPGMPVLLDIGRRTPLRALWAAKHTIEAGDECPEDWAEYVEADDMYYCPEGWYEWNEHEETHWRVSAKPLRWLPLPATPGDSHAT